MTVHDFLVSLEGITPPESLSILLEALWWDSKGDWHKAHDLIDHLGDHDSAHVHAYLHRVEGDWCNAQYWYSRANEPVFDDSLEDEWQQLLH